LETEDIIQLVEFNLETWSKLINTPKDKWMHFLDDHEDFNDIQICVYSQFAKLIYDQTVNDLLHASAPSWCLEFVDMLMNVGYRE
jgi:hypothetical protein